MRLRDWHKCQRFWVLKMRCPYSGFPEDEADDEDGDDVARGEKAAREVELANLVPLTVPTVQMQAVSRMREASRNVKNTLYTPHPDWFTVDDAVGGGQVGQPRPNEQAVLDMSRIIQQVADRGQLAQKAVATGAPWKQPGVQTFAPPPATANQLARVETAYATGLGQQVSASRGAASGIEIGDFAGARADKSATAKSASATTDLEIGQVDAQGQNTGNVASKEGGALGITITAMAAAIASIYAHQSGSRGRMGRILQGNFGKPSAGAPGGQGYVFNASDRIARAVGQRQVSNPKYNDAFEVG